MCTYRACECLLKKYKRRALKVPDKKKNSRTFFGHVFTYYHRFARFFEVKPKSAQVITGRGAYKQVSKQVGVSPDARSHRGYLLHITEAHRVLKSKFAISLNLGKTNRLEISTFQGRCSYKWPISWSFFVYEIFSVVWEFVVVTVGPHYCVSP